MALTKVDVADPDMVELVRLETTELVSGSFLERAAIVPVSARTGEGLAEVRRGPGGDGEPGGQPLGAWGGPATDRPRFLHQRVRYRRDRDAGVRSGHGGWRR